MVMRRGLRDGAAQHRDMNVPVDGIGQAARTHRLRSVVDIDAGDPYRRYRRTARPRRRERSAALDGADHRAARRAPGSISTPPIACANSPVLRQALS